MTRSRYLARFIPLLALSAAGAQPHAVAGQGTSTLYSGGDVITMDPGRPLAEAVLVSDGRIVAVGSLQEVASEADGDVDEVDLEGRALLPGFIDAHGHIGHAILFGQFANLASPPVGEVEGINELVATLEVAREGTPAGEWIVGVGYDDALLEEGRHPDRRDLDRVSTEHPIFILHVSGHLGVCNSKCLEVVGISASVDDPPGGVIRRFADSGEPNGVLEERAIFDLFYQHLPAPNEDERLGLLDGAQDYFASRGITTVQDGVTSEADLALFQRAAEEGKLRVDLVAYPQGASYASLAEQYAHTREYHNGFRVGGVKLLLDGSPQGKTAWLSEPYFEPPDGRDARYSGYGLMSDDALQTALMTYFELGVPVLAHANGDAAAEQLIRANEQARKALGDADRRTVVIHAQTLRRDQIERLNENSMMPSYFAAHTFYWGDWHRDSVLGPERGMRISPLASTTDLEVPYTIHNDSPIVPPDMMLLLWSAVNRVTRSGQVLGSDERIPVEEALKAITINAAYQYFEEDEKGSLEPGKLADMVILSENPLKVDPMSIKDIEVLETIKQGETIYQK